MRGKTPDAPHINKINKSEKVFNSKMSGLTLEASKVIIEKVSIMNNIKGNIETKIEEKNLKFLFNFFLLVDDNFM